MLHGTWNLGRDELREMRNAYSILVGNYEQKKPGHRYKNINKVTNNILLWSDRLSRLFL